MNLEIQNKYSLNTYHINQNLSYTIAFDKTKSWLPANGGLRFCQYASITQQEEEALTLAKCMTQKHNLYNTGFSGLKIVANGQVNLENKKILLNHVGKTLNNFNGCLYTGCDLNIDNFDMDYLSKITPYILNSMDSRVDTSTATAHGVYGAFEAVIGKDNIHLKKPVILVHGVGKIGSVIVNELIDKGYVVYTYDVNKDNANIEGTINISDKLDWYAQVCDYLILCSTSNIINLQNVNKLQCRWIISSANSPFVNDEVTQILAKRKINWIPDIVSNAGAVICDSFEYKDSEKYKKINPKQIYQKIYQVVFSKTKQILNLAEAYNVNSQTLVNMFFSIAHTDIELYQEAS